MGRFSLFILLFGVVLSGFDAVAGAKYEASLKSPIEILKLSKSGADLIERLRRTDVKVITGDVSRTEFKALRKIGEDKPKSWDITVYISKEKSTVDQVMDLAHELTHAVSDRLNPYDPDLKVEDYVAHGIESSGGEAQAIINECEVGRELLGKVKAQDEDQIRRRCTNVWAQTIPTESKKSKRVVNVLDAWKKSFYAVGDHFSWVKKVLKSMPLTPRDPQFVSAVAKQPYPLALMEEFTSLSQELCQRAAQRLNMRQGNPVDRVFLKRRCQDLL